MQYTSYHDLLSDELQRRSALNKSYSLRAFARDLGLPASRLSLVLNKKQGLSLDVAESVASKLKLDDGKAAWFCSSVGELHSRSDAERKKFKKQLSSIKHEARLQSEMLLEYFKVISDWYHFAILEMTYLERFKYDPAWIAQELDIMEVEVEQAIGRLIDLGLAEVKNGRLIDTFKFLATPSDVPSEALKKFNNQIMEKALTAQREQSIEKREFSANIFALDSSQLPILKEKLRDLRREFVFEASKARKKDAVYCLGMQFFDLGEGKK